MADLPHSSKPAPAPRQLPRFGRGRLLLAGLLVVLSVGLCWQLGLAAEGDDSTAEPRWVAASAATATEASAAMPPRVDGIAAGGRFLELQNRWEDRLKGKAQQALAPAYGQGVVVSVSATLDPDWVTQAGVALPENGRLPPNRVVIDRTLPQPRPASPAVETAPRAFASKLRRDLEAVGAVETRHIDADLYGRRTVVPLAPDLRRITASILVDERLLADRDRQTVLAGIVDVVKHAIGFDAERGDAIGQPAVALFAAPSPTPSWATLPGWGWLAGLGLLSVLGVVILLLGLRRRRELTQASPEQLAAQMRQAIESAIDADPSTVSRMLGQWAAEKPS